MFTLRAAAAYPNAKIITCEPVPRNLEQLREHLRTNGVVSEVVPVCIGGEHGNIPFYVREANQGSFNPEKPFASKIDVEVVTLPELTAMQGVEKLLIKLDIEGMELEVLDAYVPGERRAVCVVGELHNHKDNHQRMQQIFLRQGWKIEFEDAADAGSVFRAESPAAMAMLSRT